MMEIYEYDRLVIFLANELCITNSCCEQRWNQIVKLTAERDQLNEQISEQQKRIEDLTALLDDTVMIGK